MNVQIDFRVKVCIVKDLRTITALLCTKVGWGVQMVTNRSFCQIYLLLDRTKCLRLDKVLYIATMQQSSVENALHGLQQNSSSSGSSILTPPPPTPKKPRS